MACVPDTEVAVGIAMTAVAVGMTGVVEGAAFCVAAFCSTSAVWDAIREIAVFRAWISAA